jgi:hypothetical protein
MHNDDDEDGRQWLKLNTGMGILSLVIRGQVSVVGSVWCNDHRAHTKSEKSQSLKSQLKIRDDYGNCNGNW